MKIAKRMINEAVKEKCGELACQIAEFLQRNSGSTEFEIGESIGVEVNKVRKALYAMVDANIACFSRKRDPEMNIYVYRWEFKEEKVYDIIKNMKKDKAKLLKKKLDYEKNRTFYICTNNCKRMPFEDAVEYDFWCPECGSMMVEDDNSKKIILLQEELNKIS